MTGVTLIKELYDPDETRKYMVYKLYRNESGGYIIESIDHRIIELDKEEAVELALAIIRDVTNGGKN